MKRSRLWPFVNPNPTRLMRLMRWRMSRSAALTTIATWVGPWSLMWLRSMAMMFDDDQRVWISTSEFTFSKSRLSFSLPPTGTFKTIWMIM